MTALKPSKAEKHDPALHMEMETLRGERQERLTAEETQAERALSIQQGSEIAGRIQAFSMMGKLVTVTTLVQLKRAKDLKVYRDIPGIGTWEKYCDYLGIDRHTINEKLNQLGTLGEEFMVTAAEMQISFRDLRALRQLTHDGAVIIDGDCLRIDDESIPIDQDHAEDLQAAIERIINDRQQISQRVDKLEKQFKSAVDEETKGLKTEKKALLKEVERLKVYDPEERDRSFCADQMEAIRESTLELVAQMSKFIVMPDVTDDPVIMGQVEGYMQTAELALKDLRGRWEDTVNLFEA